MIEVPGILFLMLMFALVFGIVYLRFKIEHIIVKARYRRKVRAHALAEASGHPAGSAYRR